MSNIPLFSVTELSKSIKESLEKKYDRIKVRGEITGIKNWKGHLLFNLKDEDSLLSCRIWKNIVDYLEVIPEDGMEIISTGRISTHMQRSNYNFIVENIKLEGEGALLKIVERRKKKFRELGYFDEEGKNNLPYLPNKIGVITSVTGVVIEDIKKTIRERFPSHLVLWPVSVQGIKSELEISNAIKGFNSAKSKPEVIILARGGGSIEDLMPFNSELVVSSINQSVIPIISAIGHETDYTLSDLAADKRASTPTYAANIVVPEIKNLKKNLIFLEANLNKNISAHFKKNSYKVNAAKSRIINPKNILELSQGKYSDSFRYLEQLLFSLLSKYNLIIERSYLKNPKMILENKNISYLNLKNSHLKSFSKFLKLKKSTLQNFSKILDSLSYERLLEKGFVIVKDKDMRIIKNNESLKLEDTLNIRFLKGTVSAKIKKIDN